MRNASPSPLSRLQTPGYPHQVSENPFFLIGLAVAIGSGLALHETISSYEADRANAWRPFGERIAVAQVQIKKHRAVVDR